MRLVVIAPLFAAAAASLCAQGTLVSPAHFATIEATSSSVIPFASSVLYHHLQVHDDLAGTPRTIRGMSLRRSGPFNITSDTAYSFTLDAWCSAAATSSGTISATFASNHGANRTQVITNKTVNFPASAPTIPFPNPFIFDVPFDAPFTHAGASGLAWEVQVLTRTNTVSLNSHDAASSAGGINSNPSGQSSPFGTGCTAFGKTVAMTSAGTSLMNWPAVTGRITVSATDAPNNAISITFLGFSSSSYGGVPLPFLLPGSGAAPSGPCHLYTGLTVLAASVASATGAVAAVNFDFPATPDLDGVNVFAQVLSLDAQANPTGLVLSGAVHYQLVAPYTAVPLGRVYANSASAPMGTVQTNLGLVVRFQL